MALNLHAAVRQVIPALNADVTGYWYQSIGALIGSDGRQQPAYNAPVTVQCQVQPPSGRDLKHIDFLQMQGVIRTVWMFSDPQQIVRVNASGGDLILFPQWSGQPNDTWLVAQVEESWDVSSGGWTKLFAVLQTDRLYSSMQNGLLVLDTNGVIVRTK